MQTKDTLTLKTSVPTKFDNSTTMILYTGALDVLKNLEYFLLKPFDKKNIQLSKSLLSTKIITFNLGGFELPF